MSSTSTEATKACNKCNQAKTLNNFTVQSVNLKTQRRYYKATCKGCCSRASKYIKKEPSQMLKRGKKSFAETHPEKLATINEMLAAGETKKDIAAALDMNLFTLYRILRTQPS